MLKDFYAKARKATALVLSGSTLAVVLEAGEWRYRAFLNLTWTPTGWM